MVRRVLAVLSVVLLACPGPVDEGGVPADQGGSAPERDPRARIADRESPVASRPVRPALGDLPDMRRRGRVRALVARSRTDFFIDRGRPRGFAVELLGAWEKTLNAKRGRRQRKVDVVYVPLPFDALIPALLDGHGDLVAAGLTATPERRARVEFTDPYLEDVDEVVVANAEAPPLAALEDLGGRTVHVVGGTSYVGHLETLSRRLEAQGRNPIDIVAVESRLDSEDVLELVHAGVFSLTVADEHLAVLWASVLDGLVVRDDLVVHEGGVIAWAVRPESHLLRESLNAFLAEHRRGTLLGNVLFQRYFEDTRWIRNPLGGKGRSRFQRFEPLFRRYGQRYGFDWLRIAAQAYQESGLDPNRTSPAGAVGLMQLLPTTAAELDLPDVRDPDSNVHAGVKYMALLRDRYLADPEIPEDARFDLALASYNMGPNRVRQLRSTAAERGLDPNRWFDHVELVALEEVGQEPVRYVANVNKYYVAYRWAEQRRAESESERRRLLEGAGGSGR